MKAFDDLPQPKKAALVRSQLLTKHIQQEMSKHNGQISFADFMELALYHAEFGYYTHAEFELGKHGDYTTAPEISPLFAYCFAQQCRQLFNQLNRREILEIGAGTGRFASDLLFELSRKNSEPTHYYIYEKSLALRKKQQVFLKTNCPLYDRIIWLETLPEDFVGVIIGNEVLDALSVHRFRVENNLIKEQCVIWDNGKFAWQLSLPSKEFNEKIDAIGENSLLSDGYESEINLRLTNFLEPLIHTLKQGVMLFADYGYGQKEYYHPERRKGTLTCFYQHRCHDDPLIFPGLQDITAHVNFTQLIDVASQYGCDLLGYSSQAGFLLGCGLIDFAAATEKDLSSLGQVNLHQAIKLLTFPTEMGERIKVMALGKNIAALPLLGFKLQDRRREL